MKLFFMHINNLSIITVVYKPKSELLKPIILKYKNFFPIIITNNSGYKLEAFYYQYKNVKILDSEKNLGNGGGINMCLDNCSTDFALYMDIDTNIDNRNFEKLIKYSSKIKKFAVLVPNASNKDHRSKIKKKWDMEGSIMLINKKSINNMVKFDENIFLYFEESDFFFNCIKKKLNVFFISKIHYKHDKASTIFSKY